MASGVLRRNRNGVFSTNNGDFGENGITDGLFNLLDLLDRLLLIEAVQEEIDIGRRAKLLVVIFTELSLARVELSRHGEETIDDGRARGNNVAPI